MRSVMLWLLGLGLALILAGFLVGWVAERKPVVISEPLSCFVSGEQVVCFDGSPLGTVLCEQLDAETVLCTAKR